MLRVPENPVVSVSRLNKTYADGHAALKSIDLDIRRGEILALLGPNGAGKTTLISIICGIVNPTSGSVSVDGNDILSEFRAARSLIGLVPQELHTDSFETVWGTMRFSRGLFGKKPDDAHLEKVLRSLSLYDRKDSQIMTLSGGMKRRVMIAKALSHEPRVLFLDEPTAGVDVELRKEMWETVSALRESGVTIILTTHYIEEAQAMADRIGIINKGELLLVEEKDELMRKLGEKELVIELKSPLDEMPQELEGYGLTLEERGSRLRYKYDTHAERTGIASLLSGLSRAGIAVKDVDTRQKSLEDIFVSLVRETP